LIFEIDVGNSRVKWRIVDAEGATNVFGVEAGFVENLIEDHQDKKFERVRISSVRSATTNLRLSQDVQSRLGVKPEFAQSVKYCGGVVNAYVQPEKLGVDRWMAMLAGRKLVGEQAFVVVDAGSALTMDFVDERGWHSGGYIVPGLLLQLDCLSRGTAIPMNKGQFWPELVPGRDTYSAIRSGILSMVCSWIYSEIGALSVNRTKLLITGGDASVLSCELLKKGLRFDHVPDLVLDGLRVALP
jgi:type III pantothenate kinase